jgi:UDP-N-acetylglucosamine--N-acetylmuramyl-(pentapeptide) pyrophosphoryl-undecaprenol N-acetylglucosamine transferase
MTRHHFQKPLYLLASGGTGGHLFPALSLGEELKRHDRKVYLITDSRGQILNNASCFEEIFVCPIKRRAPVIGKIMLYLSLFWHTLYCYWLYRKLKPTIVVGFGGYPSLPPLIAAQLSGIPTVIHEQNAVLGRANRLLSKHAFRIATSFSETRGVTSSSTYTGNPVRPEILALKDGIYTPSQEKDPFHLLIIGGSQGARIFSEVVPQALITLPLELQRRLKITQQCRPEYLSQTKAIYRQSLLDVDLQPFFKNMDELYASAHLVIARSGASTVAELAVVGKPAILVPYAASLEGDQWYNAQILVNANAAWVFREKSFTSTTLAERLAILMSNPEKLAKAAKAVRELAQPKASINLVNTIAQVIGDLLTVKE